MSKLRPLGSNVVVRPLNGETTTASGIVIPDTVAKEKPMKGEILSIGNGKEGAVLDAVVGDVVVFTQYAPTELKIDGETFFILGFDSVLAVEDK